MLSQSDLVQILLRRDSAIQEEIVDQVLTRTLSLTPASVTVDVAEGVVTLRGTLPRRDLGPVVVRLCDDVDGVVRVVDRLRYDT
ncbi:BON domain-containing protein [Streptomyces sp. NPDC058739]|uniref:BON domain-containing protein n=1 Tax=Streptomyces sp. NPDC058739 TaxID=3346618 RepID=UPI0036971498